MHIYNLSVAYLPSILKMDTLKALGGVDFIKYMYALSPIIQYVQSQKLAKLEML